MKKLLFDHILPFLLWGIFHLWCLTLRVRNKSREGEDIFGSLPGSYILTLWHNHIFYIFYHCRRRDICLLISPSKDGDLLANLARRMGYSVVRGSTYKQPIAAGRSLIKVLRSNHGIIVVADGSRGPRHKAQPGSLQLAGITGVPVVPMAYHSKHKIEFNSWDRFILPLPFTRITVNHGEPIHVPPNAGNGAIQEKQAELETALNRIDQESA